MVKAVDATFDPKRGTRRIRFKDDAGNTWSGVGRRPKWFVEALASGKTDTELRAD